MTRQKIFVSAYACEPGLGSEIGVGWHWVLEMSKYFDLWVLTRESNRHSIEPWIAAHPEYSHIRFLYYDWPKWARFWKKGLRGVRTYYNLWQMCTNRIVKRTMRQNDIRIFHHLTYGNVLWKVSSYGQKQFFVWGPVGGLESIPEEYSRHYDKKSRMIEKVRRVVTSMAVWNRGFRKRCKQADLILCKTEITRDLISQRQADKAILFTDVAADISCVSGWDKKMKQDVTEFITVGHLDAWRGFDLIIEALPKVISKNSKIHLTIVGSGPDKVRLERLVKKYALEAFVTLAGKVSMNIYKDLMKNADVVVNAALKEGAVTVSFDSMAMGKPLICLDTTGYTRYFTNDYAILIPRKGRSEVIQRLEEAMLRMTQPEERNKLGRKAQEVSEKFSWENHGMEIKDAIMKAYTSYLTK
ncbi:glycosyltransferase [Parabacteroides goldsteinii]|uniref:glycosyltransferase family 4 protein n=1 Tax=Parabacteroides goldsteinii TaxID=328812 RepID=UPI001CCBCCE8|nr:glycosyltransferase [Parabacteroides goldsteinii]UBD76512.1 glycosyltransferase [Parabacteroides goldsteinii]